MLLRKTLHVLRHIFSKAYRNRRVVRLQLVPTEEHLKHKPQVLHQSVMLSYPPHTMSSMLSTGSRQHITRTSSSTTTIWHARNLHSQLLLTVAFFLPHSIAPFHTDHHSKHSRELCTMLHHNSLAYQQASIRIPIKLHTAVIKEPRSLLAMSALKLQPL